MSTLNRVFLIGYLADDPHLRRTPRGSLVCDFTLAVGSRPLETGDRPDRSEFLPISAWSNLAHESYERLARGSQIHLEGHLKKSRWTDRRTGQPRARIIVVADDIQFLARLRTRLPYAPESAPAPADNSAHPGPSSPTPN